ncbi:hypothetical protein FIBSPDRAFT_233026 [Athelia psychrophila]|uniref:Uncharacterized protein n=1 Tax=Athelia psychrophila TaxID=1759441 RepID=A0A165YH75_9AGAM|nr:hypothetical protein FIBSPDRAFT_233026 [Fibularhizoctonia sp. CBS 109695]
MRESVSASIHSSPDTWFDTESAISSGVSTRGTDYMPPRDWFDTSISAGDESIRDDPGHRQEIPNSISNIFRLLEDEERLLNRSFPTRTHTDERQARGPSVPEVPDEHTGHASEASRRFSHANWQHRPNVRQTGIFCPSSILQTSKLTFQATGMTHMHPPVILRRDQQVLWGQRQETCATLCPVRGATGLLQEYHLCNDFALHLIVQDCRHPILLSRKRPQRCGAPSRGHICSLVSRAMTTTLSSFRPHLSQESHGMIGDRFPDPGGNKREKS